MFPIKKRLLDAAEIIDAFRLVPRAVLVAYAWLVWYVINWYMQLPEPSTQQAALVTVVTSLIAAVIGLYQHSGRTWGGERREPMDLSTIRQRPIKQQSTYQQPDYGMNDEDEISFPERPSS